jgi:RNA polymerase sigma-70 factor (ECF subfamily)
MKGAALSEPGYSKGVELPPRAPGADAEWVRRAQAGDLAAFERLYRLHAGMVHGLCLRMVADGELAERLTQDAFVRAWRKLDGYRGEGPFGGWLRRLAVNVVIEDRRQAARERGREVSFGEIIEMAPEASGGEIPGLRTAHRADSPEARIDLERAVAALPAGARQAFVLHDVSGYKHQEIAAMLGLAEGTIKAQLHRARRLLRASLDPAGSTEEP